MNLSAGTRLGPYEVLSPLGAGGMGEVWKARDTRLNRIVAIKFSKTAKVYRLNLATGRKQLWRELMPPDPAGVYFIRPPQFSSDGNSYAYSYARLLSDLYVVDGFK
jgi:serine/threonine protein kinase